MKASELRIGNYVLDAKGSLLKVTNLNVEDREEFIRAWQIKTPAIGTTSPLPVPLTGEWLVRFGFKISPHLDCFYDKGDFRIKWDALLNYWLLCCNIKQQPNFKYVHQLQNLYFALTGEELTIK